MSPLTLAGIRDRLDLLPDGLHREDSPRRWWARKGPTRWLVQMAPHIFDLPDLATLSPRQHWVIDQNVWGRQGQRITAYAIRHRLDWTYDVFGFTEATKDLTAVEQVIEGIEASKMGRQGLVVAMGGGVLMDIGAVAASLWRGGVPLVKLPTTGVGIWDAGIGVKAYVNQGRKKSLIGGYPAPVAAFIDPGLIATQPTAGVRAATGELVKMGLLYNDTMLSDLRAHGEQLITSRFSIPVGQRIIVDANDAMLGELARNPLEAVQLRGVDWGHKISKALELLAGLPHGVAVGIDMATFLRAVDRRGHSAPGFAERGLQTLEALGLPLSHPDLTPDLISDALTDSTRHRGNALVPYPDGQGRVSFGAFTPGELYAAVEDLRARCD